MGVAGAGEIFGRAAEFHQHGGLGNEFAGAEADDMNAEHTVGRAIGKDLHETIGMAHGPSAAVGGEGKAADRIGNAGGLQLFLGAADGGCFRRGIEHARDHAVIHMAMLAGNDLGDGDALVLGLMGEHRPADDIADRIDAGNIGRETIVDHDAAAFERDARRFEAEPSV